MTSVVPRYGAANGWWGSDSTSLHTALSSGPRLLADDGGPRSTAARGLENVRYARCAGTIIPLVDASVDFAYSVLTVQHTEREHAFVLLRELRV
jgi:hypothetical protein